MRNNEDSASKALRSIFPGEAVVQRLWGTRAESKLMHELPWRQLVDTKFELVRIEREFSDKVEAEPRDLTTAEDEALQHLDATIRRYQHEMNFRDLLGDRGPRTVTAGRASPSGETRSIEDMRGGSRAEPENFFIDQNGKRVRIYRSTERLARPEYGQADEPRVTLGDIAYRVLLGVWPTADVDSAARAMNITTGAEGAFLVPAPLSLSVIDFARAQSCVLRAGAKTVVMDSNTLDLSRAESDPQFTWKQELASAGVTQPAIGRVTLRAHTALAIVPVSRELLADATPDLSATLEKLLTRAFGAELDRVALVGTGAANNQPQGIAGMPGVSTLGGGGAITKYDFVSKAVETCRMANFEPTGMISSPGVYGALDRLSDLQGQPMRPPRSFEELTHFSSTNVSVVAGPPVESSAFVGAWAEALFGIRRSLEIRVSLDGAVGSVNAVSDYAAFVIAAARVDFTALRPAAFTHVTNLELP